MTLFHPQPALRTAFVIALIQFANALEYMMINPIFPYMANTLKLPVSHAGYVSGVYTLACVLSGLAAYKIVDRFPKKKLLTLNLLLLGLMTALTPYATSWSSLIAIRFGAGLCGGLTLGVGMALLLNQTPPALRGKAIATVLAAFSVVSIVGLPLALLVANHLGWQWSFWLVAGLCLLCVPLLHALVAAEAPSSRPEPQQTLSLSPRLLWGVGASALTNFSPFLLIPLLAPLFTDLLAQPLSQLPLLFLGGGLSALAATKLSGKACDRYSPLNVATAATVLFLLSLLLLALPLPTTFKAYGFMLLFMFGTYGRMVAATVLAAAIPTAAQRGGFSVLQTACNHLSASAAFGLPAWWLHNQAFSQSNLWPLVLLAGISALSLLPYLSKLKGMAQPESIQ